MTDRIKSVINLVSLRARHTWRQTTDTAHLFALLGGLVAGLSWILVQPFGHGAYYYGTLLRAGKTAAVSDVIHHVAVTFFVLLSLMFVFREANNIGRFDSRRLFVSITVPRTTHVAGAILYECLFLLAIAAIPVTLASISFAIGAQSVTAGLSLAFGSLPFIIVVPVITYPLGFTVNYLLDSLQATRMTKVLLGLGFLFVYEVLILRTEDVVSLLLRTPIQWYGDTLLIFVSGVSSSPVAAISPIVLPLVVFSPSVSVAAHFADSVWYGATGNASPKPNSEKAGSASWFDKLTEYLGRSHSGSIAVLTLQRTVRSPYVLLYSVVPIVPVILTAYTAVSDGNVPVVFPTTVVFFGGIASGSMFPLNPLGNDGDSLPWLLTSLVTPGEYLRGKLLAASLIAVPFVTLLTVFVGAITTYAPLQIVFVTVFALVVVGGAPVVAIGVGLLFPNYEQSAPIRGIQTALPSRAGLAAFGLCMFVVWLPGATGFLLASRPETNRATAVLAPVVGTLVSSLLVAGIGRISYRFAVERMSRDVVDRTRRANVTRDEIAAAIGVSERSRAILVSIGLITAVIGVSTVFITLLTVKYGRTVLSSFLSKSLLSAGVYLSVVVAYLVVSGRGREFIDFERPTRGELILAIGTIVGLIGVQFASSLLLPSNANSLATRLTTESRLSLLLLVPVGTLLVAPAEELLFRNLLQKRLEEAFSSLVAVAAVSLLFALFHFGTYAGTSSIRLAVGLSAVFVESLLLGAVFERSGNVCVPVVAHGCYNLIAFSLLVAGAVG